MSAPELEAVLVLPASAVEPIVHTARAELARLSLQLRTVTYEADELEQAWSVDDVKARQLLQLSLDELVESRRAELDQNLHDERDRAMRVVEAARRDATRVEPAPPVTSRRLHVVAPEKDVELDEEPVCGPSELLAPPAGEEGEPPPITPHEPSEPPGDPEESASVESREAPVSPTPPDALGELVGAAVSAAMSQALAAVNLAAMHHPAPMPVPANPVDAHLQPSRGAERTEVVAGRRRPFWRSAMHVDVLLPLLAVLVVFVVLLAWVG